MQRFRFSLERVLRLKKQRKRLAEARQAETLARLREIEAEEEVLKRELQKTALGMQEKLAQGLNLTNWLNAFRQAESIGKSMANAQARRLVAVGRVAEAAAALRQVAQETEALIQLRERHWQAYREAVNKTEQIQLDDLGLRRWRGAEDSGPLPEGGQS